MQVKSGAIDINECVHGKYLKHNILLNLVRCTSSYIVHGKTRHFPLNVSIFTRMVLFWANIINTSENKLSKIAYLYIRNTIPLSDRFLQ